MEREWARKGRTEGARRQAIGETEHTHKDWLRPVQIGDSNNPVVNIQLAVEMGGGCSVCPEVSGVQRVRCSLIEIII